ncbi:hypothetical protein POM88_036622 [Heracleum sosnowskyi]|uniref:Glutathione S-transferase n=1 Tax=Heracleum sosnowskyi TaxID=360622 RepID=A0AAD8MCK1_9APIA|nr:hypothetical protein POM88_036622 [Heracleum sosnowskyi]
MHIFIYIIYVQGDSSTRIDYEYIAVDLSKGEQSSPEFLKLNPLSYVPVLVDEEMTRADSFAILMYLEEKYPRHPLLPKDPTKRAINYQIWSYERFDIGLPIADPERESFPVAEYWARSTVVKETSEGKGKGKISEEEATEGTWNEALKDKGKKKRKVIEEDNEELKGKGKEKAKGKEKGKKKGIEEDEDIGLTVEDLSVDKNYMDEKLGSCESVQWAQFHVNKGFAALEQLLVKYAGKYATGDEVSLADLFLAPQIHGSITRFNMDLTGYPLLLRVYKAYEILSAFQDAMPEKQPDAPKDIKGE